MVDFLKKDVQTPLYGCYLASGISLRIETNSESILSIARANFESLDDSHVKNEVRLRLWVEDAHDSPQTRPYFRGLGHLVFSGYGERSSLLIDVASRRGAGRFTQSLSKNRSYWKTVVFPSLLAIVAPSVGLTSLHSACVSVKGRGLLLVGVAASGKSTLSLALAQAGLDFLSDDRILVGTRNEELRAWGLSREMKQRADAVRHFPALRHETLTERWNGDSVFRFDPAELFGVTRAEYCEPSWIVFLERQAAPSFVLEELQPEEAINLLELDLHQEMREAAERQHITLQALSKKTCYRLRHGGDPHTVARALGQLFQLGNSRRQVYRSRSIAVNKPSLAGDPLRRFRATCLRADVQMMGRHLRIETDSSLVLKRVAETFGTFESVPKGPPQFTWRIVTEQRRDHTAPWHSMTAFCDGPLRYISLGQFSFIAADLAQREAIGVLSEQLCEDDVGFSTVILSSLLHLSAPQLGLTPVSAACVSRGKNGLLLFGPPQSGKTTAGYWGKKLGLEFHADQATFLEVDRGAVYAWGEFWPTAFRPETMRFLPELAPLARSFTYRDRTFLCVDKGLLSGVNRGRVVPAACIFLERQASSSPRLIPLPRWEVSDQIFTDAGSDDDRVAILAMLRHVPAYRLLYDDDPSIAARLFRSVLDAHQLLEQRA
ncbi:MAG TPA: hypothetical protein VFR18_02925 [Terriglobia bacterium]|nr:hypothetical protein [Terriglobia bacterium]